MFRVLIAIAMLACCLVGCSSDVEEEPTLTYDGTTAVYSGPSELEGYPAEPTFLLVNDSDKAVDFDYARVIPEAFEGVTEQDALDWGLTQDEPPPWVENGGHLALRVQGGESIEVDAVLLPGNTYELVVWDLWRSHAVFAGWIDVVEPSS